MKRVMSAFAAVALCLLTGAAWGTSMPALPYPQGSTVGMVGDEMIVNGLPSRVREIRWPGRKRAELIEFYKVRLVARKTSMPLRMGDTDIVSGMLGRTYVTVMAHDGAGGAAYAKLMQADLSRPSRVDLASSTPTGSRMLTHVESMDAGRASSILMYANTQSIETNVDFAVDRMQARGYRVSGKERDSVAGEPGTVVTLSDGQGSDVTMSVMLKKGLQVVTIQTIAAVGSSKEVRP